MRADGVWGVCPVDVGSQAWRSAKVQNSCSAGHSTRQGCEGTIRSERAQQRRGLPGLIPSPAEMRSVSIGLE